MRAGGGALTTDDLRPTTEGCQPKAWRLKTLTSLGCRSGPGRGFVPGTWALVL